MNSIQRRLFRVFAEVGGDLTEDTEVDRFIRCVEGNLLLLPPKVREATELLWRSKDSPDYAQLTAELSRRDPIAVTAATLRQRVSRGVRLLENAVRRRPWGGLLGNGSAERTAPAARTAAGVSSHPAGSGAPRRRGANT
jgi:hypothetical protein